MMCEAQGSSDASDAGERKDFEVGIIVVICQVK